MRGPRSSIRWAVAGSVGLHAGLLVVAVVAARWPDSRPIPATPPLDTRVADVPVRFVPPKDEPITVETVEAVEKEPGGSRPPLAKDLSQATPTEATGPPLARSPAVPSPLPPELLAVIRKPGPVGPPVIEVAVQPTSQTGPPGAVQQTAANPGPTAPPIHGRLGPGKSIVYVLDMSGSMGEWGKFAAARRALLATLRAQPESVRVQVVVYAGTARTVLPGGECVPATVAAVGRVEQAFAGLEPAGRSDHAAGLRAALELRPDVVLVLTDADDLSAAKLRGMIGRVERPAAVCVGRVTATGVSPPRELK